MFLQNRQNYKKIFALEMESICHKGEIMLKSDVFHSHELSFCLQTNKSFLSISLQLLCSIAKLGN